MSRDEQARKILAATYDQPHIQKAVLETPMDEMGPWFHHAIRAIIEALRGASGGGAEYKLPCDVHLPPATVIKAGVSLETLKLAMELEGRPRHFHGNARASLPAPDHPAENAKSSGGVRADALNRYFHEAADAQEEADLLRAALENLADAADVVMGREVFEPTRWPEWIDLANASLAARAALARSGKGEG